MKIEDVLVVSRRLSLTREGQAEVYHSLIQDVGRASFAISPPTSRTTALVLRPGDRVKVTVLARNEQYVFDSRVQGRQPGSPPLYVLSVPPLESVRRVQLREHVRVQVALEFHYRPVTEEELPDLLLLDLPRRAITLDMSGGGLLAVMREPLPEGQLLALRLDLPLRKAPVSFPAVGRVRRCRETTIDRRNRYLVAVSFEVIAEKHRDQLIAFLFQRMHDQMRHRSR